MNRNTRINLNILGLAIATVLLSACGGGGGGVRPDGPPPPPTPQVCNDPNATNQGGALPCTYRYNGEADNLLVPHNADLAHAEGFTGKGVKVGMFDTKMAAGTYEWLTLQGRIAKYDGEVGGIEQEHGNSVAAVMVGSPVGNFKGGVATGADLYWYGKSVDRFNLQRAINDGVRLFNQSMAFESPRLF